MRVLVEVINRPLYMRGPFYRVGERLFLDPADPRDRQVLDRGDWVRRLDPVHPAVPANQPVVAAIAEPPVNRMVGTAAVTRQPSAARGKRQQ